MPQFSAIGVEPSSVGAPVRTAAFKRRQSSAARCVAHATTALSGLTRRSHIFGLTKGQFSMIDLADAALSIVGPARVAVWTWCIAEYEVEAFGAFLRDGQILDLRVVMDWAGAQRDMPVVAEVQQRFGLDAIRVTKTHAKIVTIATEDGWRVVIRGSMNLNANPRFEQFDVSDDAATYEVIEGVMADLWARGKPLPVRHLAHSDATALLDAGEAQAAAPTAWGPSTEKRWF